MIVEYRRIGTCAVAALVIASACAGTEDDATAVVAATAPNSTTVDRTLDPSVTRPASQNDGTLDASEYTQIASEGIGALEGSAVLRDRSTAEQAGGVICQLAEWKYEAGGDTEIYALVERLADSFGSPTPVGDAMAATAAAYRMCGDLLTVVEVDWAGNRPG